VCVVQHTCTIIWFGVDVKEWRQKHQIWQNLHSQLSSVHLMPIAIVHTRCHYKKFHNYKLHCFLYLSTNLRWLYKLLLKRATNFSVETEPEEHPQKTEDSKTVEHPLPCQVRTNLHVANKGNIHACRKIASRLSPYKQPSIDNSTHNKNSFTFK